MTDGIPDEVADQFRALCGAVGFVVVNWALIEQQIDYQVSVAFNQCGGRNLRRDRDIPRSFGQKARFLKDCFKKQTRLRPFAEEGVSLVERAEKLSKERHNLVHGGITSMEHTDGAFQFRKIRYGLNAHTLASFTFHPDDFSRLGEEVGELLTDVIAFTQKIVDEFLE